MSARAPEFRVKIAETQQEIQAAQHLRYAVFVEEGGAAGADVDHRLALEADRFDLFADHLLLIDKTQSFNNGVVGTYRLLPEDRAQEAGGFYSAAEFDLSCLHATNRPTLELGRSCVWGPYRGGTAVFELWSGLARYVLSRGVSVLFGVASFPGTDLTRLAQPLDYLHRHHLAAPPLRVTAIGDAARRLGALSDAPMDRKAAMLAMPPLIKAYLRAGGAIGLGAWCDRTFNTTDVCMVLDVDHMPERVRALYSATGRDLVGEV